MIELHGNTEFFTVDSLAYLIPRVGIIAISLLQETKIITLDVISKIVQFPFAMIVILLSQSLFLFLDRVFIRNFLPLRYDEI